MPLVIVGGEPERVEQALQAFERQGFSRLVEPVAAIAAVASAAGAGGDANLVMGVAGGGAERLRTLDGSGVRYVLVHHGPPDGEPGGTYERAHHRVEAAELAELARRVQSRDRPLVTCVAFSYRRGIPEHSAWVVDVRFLDNPYWVPELRSLDGQEERVRRYVLDQPAAGRLLDGLQATFGDVVAEYARRGRMELTLAFGCTGGRHRSVVIAQELARRLGRRPDVDVAFEARDLAPEASHAGGPPR